MNEDCIHKYLFIILIFGNCCPQPLKVMDDRSMTAEMTDFTSDWSHTVHHDHIKIHVNQSSLGFFICSALLMLLAAQRLCLHLDVFDHTFTST